MNDAMYIPPRQIMGFKRLGGNIRQPGLDCHDFGIDNHRRLYFSQRHEDQRERTNFGTRTEGLYPQFEIAGEQRQKDDEQ